MKWFFTWICLIVAIGLIAACSGCAHNMVTYSDGIGLVTTINPETYSIGIDFRYGKILQATVKDNSKVTLNANGKLNNVAGQTASNSQNIAVEAPAGLTFETGNQITGYEVELVKILSANPEALRVWMEARKGFAVPSITPK